MKRIDEACYCCGSVEHAPYASENGFSLVKCSGCGLLYVTPRPSDEELAQAHECGVHKGEAAFDMTGDFEDKKIRPYVRVLKQFYATDLTSRARSWLDIGCGHGEFLVALQQSSGGRISARGVEPNQAKQESARLRGLDVTYFDLAEHADRYDVVSLLNVYSHLPDPPGFLKLCRTLLAPGGEILLETGDTADMPSDEHYRPLYLPDHLSFASESIVCSILAQAGFEIVEVRKYRAFPVNRSASRWIKEAIKWAWPGKQSRLGKFIAKHRMSRKYVTDMYIRARALDEPTAAATA